MPGARRPVRDAGGGRADAPRAPARAARRGARARPERLGRATLAASSAAARVPPAPASARPRRRARATGAAAGRRVLAVRGMSPAARMLRPYVLRRWRALAGAAGATVVLTAAELAKPWPLALRRRPPARQRNAPFTLDAATCGCSSASPRSSWRSRSPRRSPSTPPTCGCRAPASASPTTCASRVYDHLQRLSLGFHQRSQKGDLLTRVTGDVNAMGDLFSQTRSARWSQAGAAGGRDDRRAARDRPGARARSSLATAPLLVRVSFVFRRRVRDAVAPRAPRRRATSRRSPTRRCRRWRS